MLTVSVTTLRTGALALVAPARLGPGEGSTAGAVAAWDSKGRGSGAGVTCTGTGAGTGTGGGVLGLLRAGAALASGAGTTLLMTLGDREKRSQRGQTWSHMQSHFLLFSGIWGHMGCGVGILRANTWLSA